MLKKIISTIILVIITLLIPLAGFVIGGVFFFRKKIVAGTVYAGLSALWLIAIISMITITENPSDSTTVQPSNVQKQNEAIAAQAISKPEPVSVNLQEILDLRDANEVAADTKYIGMYMTMDGEISEIHEKDISIIPLNSDQFQMAGAKCHFDKSQFEELLQLRKGNKITVVGTIKNINDFIYNQINVDPCVFKQEVDTVPVPAEGFEFPEFID